MESEHFTDQLADQRAGGTEESLVPLTLGEEALNDAWRKVTPCLTSSCKCQVYAQTEEGTKGQRHS